MRIASLTMVICGIGACANSGGTKQYEPMYSRAIRLCIEHYLPNSMARAEGFDLDKHQSEVQAQRNELAAQFGNAAGISYVQGRIAQGGEELTMLCANELLNAARSVRR